MMGATVYFGVIDRVHGDEGPPSGITYDIKINTGDARPFVFEGVRPANGRLTDEWDIVPFPVGTGVIVGEQGGHFVFHFSAAERPATGVCGVDA